jgi:hypothetical protein
MDILVTRENSWSRYSFFLTNDIHLPSLPNLKTLVLDNLKKETESQQLSQEP